MNSEKKKGGKEEVSQLLVEWIKKGEGGKVERLKRSAQKRGEGLSPNVLKVRKGQSSLHLGEAIEGEKRVIDTYIGRERRGGGSILKLDRGGEKGGRRPRPFICLRCLGKSLLMRHRTIVEKRGGGKKKSVSTMKTVWQGEGGKRGREDVRENFYDVPEGKEKKEERRFRALAPTPNGWDREDLHECL